MEPLDIVRANRLLYATAFVSLVLFCGVPLIPESVLMEKRRFRLAEYTHGGEYPGAGARYGARYWTSRPI